MYATTLPRTSREHDSPFAWSVETVISDRWMIVDWAHRVTVVEAQEAAAKIRARGHEARVVLARDATGTQVLGAPATLGV